MTRKERNGISRSKLDIFSGILFNSQEFGEGNGAWEITYSFDHPGFDLLRETYHLGEIAGKGSDFARARRLMHNLAPRLHHSSWYDNHVACNALDLLKYSLDNPEQGIDCLNKAKILAECCLALGIYARRVRIFPASAYDFDNHVVTEVYDRKLKKWIMLDITADGYFVDREKTPLSLTEIRDLFANRKFVTFVPSTSRLDDLEKLKERHIWQNAYICKNLFYFSVERENGFGPGTDFLIVSPRHFDLRRNQMQNMQYRIDNMPEEFREFIPKMEESKKIIANAGLPDQISPAAMDRSPIKEK